MMTANRDEFLRYVRAHRVIDPKRPIRVMREMGWQPSLFSHEDGSKATVVNATPIVYITYVTWNGKDPVIFREVFGGVISVKGGAGAIEVVLEGSFHDWLIANANEVMNGDEEGGLDGFVRVYQDEPERELLFAIDRPTSLVQKM